MSQEQRQIQARNTITFSIDYEMDLSWKKEKQTKYVKQAVNGS